MDFKDRLRESIDFPALVAETVHLKRSPNGRQAVMALCPFHEEKTPSLAVYQDHAYCYGACRQSWDLYGWVMQRDRVDFAEAVRILAGKAGLQLPSWTPEQQQRAQKQQQRQDVLTVVMHHYQRQLLPNIHLPAYQYARSRGWSAQTVSQSRLGYADDQLRGILEMLDSHQIPHQKAIDAGILVQRDPGPGVYLRFRNRLVFPFMRAGQCVYMTARALDPEAQPKWLHLSLPDDERRPLYGDVSGSSPLILVESPADVLTLRQLGYQAAATLGPTLPEGTESALRKHRPLWVMYDDDKAGRKGIHTVGKALGPQIRVAMLPEGLDANAHLVEYGPQGAREIIQQTLERAPTFIEHLAVKLGGAPPSNRDQEIDDFFSVAARMEERDYLVMRRRLMDLSGYANDVRTFESLLKHYGQQNASDNGFTPSLDGRYAVCSGVICAMSGNSPSALTNFSAQIERTVKLDDGESIQTEYHIIGATEGGRKLSTARVPTGKFGQMAWIDENWGVSAVIASGKEKPVATAIKLLSQGARSEHVYTHTGWREIDGQRVYLHCGGAVGYSGQGAKIQVDLGPELDHYYLPDRPDDPPEAFRASLRFLEVADPMVTYPIWAAMYHAPLAEILSPRFVLWAYGKTDTKKSTTLLLAMQHYGNFGVEGDAVNWSSTANAMEMMAFKSKDAPILIDDFAHQPNAYEQRKLQQTAERLIRSTGNETGRIRMADNLRLRRTYRVRALILATGETLPTVAPSAHNRILPLRFTENTVSLPALTEAQKESELYRHALCGYLIWLRDRWESLASTLPQRHIEMRTKSTTRRTGRLTDVICRSALAGSVALEYGQAIGAIDEKTAKQHREIQWDILHQLADTQDKEVRSEDPVKRFCHLLLELLDQGRGWLAALEPLIEDPEIHRPNQAEMLGWKEEKYYWLHFETAYAQICKLAYATGQPMLTSLREMQERLKDEGILVQTESDRYVSRCYRVPGNPRLVKLDRGKIDVL
jgi:DNA primase catalytic core